MGRLAGGSTIGAVRPTVDTCTEYGVAWPYQKKYDKSLCVGASFGLRSSPRPEKDCGLAGISLPGIGSPFHSAAKLSRGWPSQEGSELLPGCDA